MCVGMGVCSMVLWSIGFVVGWSLVRPPVRAAVELLYVAALASLTVPLANALLTGDHFIVAALHGRWGVAGFDIGAIALAVGYVVLARATQRRAHNGPAESVWALRPATPEQAAQPALRKADAS